MKSNFCANMFIKITCLSAAAQATNLGPFMLVMLAAHKTSHSLLAQIIFHMETTNMNRVEALLNLVPAKFSYNFANISLVKISSFSEGQYKIIPYKYVLPLAMTLISTECCFFFFFFYPKCQFLPISFNQKSIHAQA